ncbi:MAG: nitroreductase/quinone reductase family protein [Acidimicrobiales bacterium]|nr:nitroreductase/quinone reductase family protein [Acidimicrobiales bacterium]
MALKRPESQKADPQSKPPDWLIPWFSKLNTFLYRRSGGRILGSGGGMWQLLLTVTGRKSGKTQTVTLPYWFDDDGTLILVASNAGQDHNPAWYHNVKDTSANPTVAVQIRATHYTASATVLEGDERADVWARLTDDRPNYGRYQDRTTRVIPLIRLTVHD